MAKKHNIGTKREEDRQKSTFIAFVALQLSFLGNNISIMQCNFSLSAGLQCIFMLLALSSFIVICSLVYCKSYMNIERKLHFSIECRQNILFYTLLHLLQLLGTLGTLSRHLLTSDI